MTEHLARFLGEGETVYMAGAGRVLAERYVKSLREHFNIEAIATPTYRGDVITGHNFRLAICDECAKNLTKPGRP